MAFNSSHVLVNFTYPNQLFTHITPLITQRHILTFRCLATTTSKIQLNVQVLDRNLRRWPPPEIVRDIHAPPKFDPHTTREGRAASACRVTNRLLPIGIPTQSNRKIEKRKPSADRLAPGTRGAAEWHRQRSATGASAYRLSVYACTYSQKKHTLAS